MIANCYAYLDQAGTFLIFSTFSTCGGKMLVVLYLDAEVTMDMDGDDTDTSSLSCL